MRIQVLPPLVPDEPESGGANIGTGSEVILSNKEIIISYENEVFSGYPNESMSNHMLDRNSKISFVTFLLFFHIRLQV